jgi:hypothetical protein
LVDAEDTGLAGKEFGEEVQRRLAVTCRQLSKGARRTFEWAASPSPLGVWALFIGSNVCYDIFMAQIAVDTGISFTCTSPEECKRKCEEHGGRWKKDPTGTTHGTCTLAPTRGGLGGLLTPGHLAALLVSAGGSFLLGRLIRKS